MQHSFGEGANDETVGFFTPVLQSIWFTDKVHFHPNGYIKKYTVKVWYTEDLHKIMETLLHPQNVQSVVHYFGL